jgi:hypothetical protein
MRFRDCVVFLQTDLDGSHLTPSLQHSVNKDCLLSVLLNREVFNYEAAKNCYTDYEQGFSGS